MFRMLILVALVGLLVSAILVFSEGESRPKIKPTEQPSQRATLIPGAPVQPNQVLDAKRQPPTDTVLSNPAIASESKPSAAAQREYVGSIIDGVWIEDGTPRAFLKSCIEGYKPAKVFADGSQVFENMPGKVRNAQGQMEDRKVTITVNPAKAVPVDSTEAGK